MLLLVAPAFAAEEPPFQARLADGTRVHGKKLDPWDEQHLVPTLDGQAWNVHNPPHWLRVHSPAVEPLPVAFVEWVGGDRLPGTVVAWQSGFAQPFQRLPSHLVVESERLTAGGRRHVRVATASLRRVVWRASHARPPEHYEPGTAWLRFGNRLAFTAIRWEEHAVTLLREGNVERVPFEDVAELHLPAVDPWEAYTRQLAGLTCPDGARLLTVELQDGARLTVSAARVRRPATTATTAPALLVQPAWSLDPVRVAMADVRLWLSLSPLELPLSWLEPVASRQRHVFAAPRPWRRNRNVEGEPLTGVDEPFFAWGFGVHAQHEFEFSLPDCARTLRTRFGLDPRVRDGGCVRAKVLVNGGSLFESPLVLGSRPRVDTGTLTLPTGSRRRLSLIADMAHENRPPGTDPFDIRDTSNWLEPLLGIDPVSLWTEVRQRAAEWVPAWDGWTVTGDSAGHLLSRWDDREQRFVTEIRPAGTSLTIQQQLRPRPDDRFLLLFVTRQRHATNATRLRVLAEDEVLAEFDVPPTRLDDDPDPWLVSLPAKRDTPLIRIEQTTAGERSFVSWRELKLASQRPGEARLFDGEQRLTVAEGAVATKSRAVRLAVARIPRPGQFRFFRFAWQKQGGMQIRLTLHAGERQVVYQVGSPSTAGTPLEFPAQWQSEIRDLFEDFGQRETTITGVTLEAPDGEVARFDDLVVVRNLRDLDVSSPVHPLGDLPRQMRRGWGLEMHGEMIRQVSPDFNTNSPTRANTVTLFSRWGGRTAVIENDAPQVFGLQLTVPMDLRTRLEATIGRRPWPWRLVVRVDGQVIHEQPVEASPTPHWEDVSVDLTRFAGKAVLLEPHGQGGGVWAKLEVVSE